MSVNNFGKILGVRLVGPKNSLSVTLIGGVVVVKNCVAKPDKEQQKILELLKVKLT